MNVLNSRFHVTVALSRIMRHLAVAQFSTSDQRFFFVETINLIRLNQQGHRCLQVPIPHNCPELIQRLLRSSPNAAF